MGIFRLTSKEIAHVGPAAQQPSSPATQQPSNHPPAAFLQQPSSDDPSAIFLQLRYASDRKAIHRRRCSKCEKGIRLSTRASLCALASCSLWRRPTPERTSARLVHTKGGSALIMGKTNGWNMPRDGTGFETTSLQCQRPANASGLRGAREHDIVSVGRSLKYQDQISSRREFHHAGMWFRCTFTSTSLRC
jgi:hypothetical protein